MPSAHRRYAEWTPARIKREAAKIGTATIALVKAIMKAKPHPEQGFRACLGILRLARTTEWRRIADIDGATPGGREGHRRSEQQPSK
jgi:transposase